MILEVNNLVKEYPRPGGGFVRAVDNVSFSIPKGKTLGIIGESGSGKSTVGRCVLRLVEPTSGQVALLGNDIGKLSQRQLRPLRPQFQMVFQDPYGSVNPAFTVEETLDDALRSLAMSRVDRERRKQELLDSVRLPLSFLSRRTNQISGGQLQRVAIARALAPQPQFIFLDEPTSALDVSIRGQIINLLAELQERLGITYLFVSHDLNVVRVLADRVLVMYDGRAVEEGTVDDILNRPRHEYTQMLIAASLD